MRAVVGGDEPAEHPARVVLAVVGLVREQDDDAEVVARRVAQLGLEDVDDLRRPQELVLEVDQPLRRCAARGCRSRASRTRRAAARGRRPRARCGRTATVVSPAGGERPPAARSASPAVASQRSAKCAATSRTIGPRSRATRRASRSLVLVRVLVGVVAVAGQRRQVDAADERDLVVDDHELLVVAVHQPPCRRRARTGSSCRCTSCSRAALTVAAARLEHRHGRARPHEHAHRHALGGLGQQLLHRRGRARAGVEVGLQVPRADVHVALRAADRLGHPRQRVRAVDQHLAARCPRAAARRSAPTGPRSPGASARELPVPAQAAHVVVDHRALDAVADGGVEAVEHRELHADSPYPLASSPWPPISPPRSAWPPSASRCPCSRTIFDPAGCRSASSALEAEMGAAGFWDDPDARGEGRRRAHAHAAAARRVHEAAGRRRGPREPRRDGRGGRGHRRRARGGDRLGRGAAVRGRGAAAVHRRLRRRATRW